MFAEQGGSMSTARKLGMRTFAYSTLFGSASAVVVLIHHSLNLHW